MTEFLSLAAHRPPLRYFVEVLFQRMLDGLVECQLDLGDIPAGLKVLSKKDRAYFRFLTPIFLKSHLAMEALSSWLTTRVLGSCPSTEGIWQALQVISLLLNERGQGRRSQNFVPLQNFLMNVKAGLFCNLAEHGTLGKGDMVATTEELLRLSYDTNI